MSIISQQKTRGVKFLISKNKVSVLSSDPDLGEATEDLEVSYTGKDLEVGFNARYLIDGLQVISSKEIELILNTELSPGILKGKEEEGFQYIIMPMRL
jgi:DNA polymerase-3 subunit beta